jgi:hypothetical protein
VTNLFKGKGYILKTNPFGSVFYLVFIALFWIGYWILVKNYKKLSRTKTKEQLEDYNLKSKKSWKRVKWLALVRIVKTVYDLKMFLFNLFVLDLTTASIYELSQTLILVKMFKAEGFSVGMLSHIASTCILIGIMFEFMVILIFRVNMEKRLSKLEIIRKEKTGSPPSPGMISPS